MQNVAEIFAPRPRHGRASHYITTYFYILIKQDLFEYMILILYYIIYSVGIQCTTYTTLISQYLSICTENNNIVHEMHNIIIRNMTLVGCVLKY